MAWLASEYGRRQFLTWLVRGAVRWYKDGRTLGALPAKLQTALDDYMGGPHIDKLLSRFVQEHCIQEEGAIVAKRAFHASFVQKMIVEFDYDAFHAAIKRLYPAFVATRKRLHRDYGQAEAFIGIRMKATTEGEVNTA